jgi:hypothetical protein
VYRFGGIDHAVQVRRCIFHVIMLVLTGSAFRGNDGAAVDVPKITVRKFVTPFGLLIVLLIDSEVPFSKLGHSVFLNEFVFFLG